MVTPAEGEEPAAERGHEPADPFGVAADHAFVRGVDNQEVDPRGGAQGLAHPVDGSLHHADAPGHPLALSESPGAAGGPALAGQVAGEEGGVLHPGQHPVPVLPGAQGEEPGRFAEAVADDRLGPDSEAPDQVTGRTAGGDLAEDDGAGIAVQFSLRCAVPEQLRLELPPEMEVLRILAAVDLGPAGGEFRSHAGVVVAGTGEDEGDLPPATERLRGMEEPVAEGRV